MALTCLGTGRAYPTPQKLAAAGMTVEQLKAADDAALRKAGIVVKGQRDKVMEAAKTW